MIEHLLRVPVTLLLRSEGPVDPDTGESTIVEEELETRCELQQESSSEPPAHAGAVQVVAWRVYLPPDAPATGWDAIRLGNGTELELEGDAWLAVSPLTGVASHVEGRVRSGR